MKPVRLMAAATAICALSAGVALAIAGPIAPTGVTIALASNTQANLSWQPVAGANAYRILRGTVAGGPYTQVGMSSGYNFSNSGLALSKTYYYVVQTYAGGQFSPSSSEVSIGTAGTAAPQAAPDPPLGFTASAATGTLVLTWTASTGAPVYHYDILRGPTSGGEAPVDAIGGTIVTYADVAAPTAGGLYYKIRAVGAYGSALSAEVFVPGAPALAASGTNDVTIHLSWSAAAGATGYNVFRSTSNSGPFGPAVFASVGGGTTTFDDTPLGASQTFYYRVQALSGSGTSAPSNVAGATTTAVQPPTGVSASAVSTSRIDLTWTASTSPDATGYVVYYGTSDPPGTAQSVSGGGATGASVNGLNAGTLYYFQVQTTTATNGSSIKTTSVTATTQASLFAASYTASQTFTDACGGFTTGLAWDGTNYWSSGAGTLGAPLAGPHRHWSLDETSGTTAFDDSGNGGHMTLSFGTFNTNAVPGKLKGALNFTGGAYPGSPVASAGPGTIPTIGPATSFTWSFWEFLPSGGSNGGFVLGNRVLATNDDATFAKFLVTDFAGFVNNLSTPILTGTPYLAYTPPTNVWVHHTVVKTGSLNYVYYANGVVVSTAPQTNVVLPPLPFYLGTDLNYPDTPFRGRLDDVRLYTRALGVKEVETLAHNQAQYTAAGALVQTFGRADDNHEFRSLFTAGGGSSPVFSRYRGSSVLEVQTAPGTFAPALTLVGGSLNADSSVVFDETANEVIAHANGVVSRWNATTGAFVGTVTLIGYGPQNLENNSPQSLHVVKAGGYYLTYSRGFLSAWDAGGNRVAQTQLTGGAIAQLAQASFSYANGLVWVCDVGLGTWRGYNVGL